MIYVARPVRFVQHGERVWTAQQICAPVGALVASEYQGKLPFLPKTAYAFLLLHPLQRRDDRRSDFCRVVCGRESSAPLLLLQPVIHMQDASRKFLVRARLMNSQRRAIDDWRTDVVFFVCIYQLARIFVSACFRL